MNPIYSWQKEVWRKLAPDTQRNAQGGSTSSAHALLLRGRKGLGKLAFAVFLAKSRLCENTSDEGEACGICSSCRWFEQGGHPDFRVIEPEALSNLLTISGSSERNGSDGDADTEAVAMAEPATDSGTESGSTKSRRKPSKQISVAQIRELADFINISSHQNGYKIILIHPAEAMNPAAANALLKNLEE